MSRHDDRNAAAGDPRNQRSWTGFQSAAPCRHRGFPRLAIAEPDADTLVQQPARAVGGERCEILLTSYMLGAPNGHNLGAPGYSHEFVARLFRPLLERWGTVTEVRDAGRDLQATVDACLRRGNVPIHFSVLPFQDVCIAEGAVNVVMPAWEFPDVPDHAFDGNPGNDWPSMADRADLVLVSGPFTANALRRAGTKTPIHIVPVPCPDSYFDLPPWRPGQTQRIDCRAYVFESGGLDDTVAVTTPHADSQSVLKAVEGSVRRTTRHLLGCQRYATLSAFIKDRRHSRRQRSERPPLSGLPYPEVDSVELSGVVYTSIFAPDDGRKNWIDLLNAFLIALGERTDATLVCKLITKNRASVERVIDYYLHRGLPHRCRVVFICDFLTDEQMLQLCRATTYYVQSTKAEGNCLPLMNYLAAGRPAVSPDHSSMSDYFTSQSGFVVESHQEPAAWPHDRRLRLRTSWARIVWTSLRDQIALSHQLTRERPRQYTSLSESCRTAMRDWAGREQVTARLDAALEAVISRVARSHHTIAGERTHTRRRAA
jgi:hypothetical protein